MSSKQLLEGLKARVRAAVLPGRYDLHQLLADEDEDGVGLLALSSIVELFAALGVETSEEEEQALVARYGDHRRCLRYAKLYRFLELAPPTDYVDPELLVAQLPNPYRMIVKLLDACIVEPAWAIVEQHQAIASGKAKELADRQAFPTFHLAELGTVVSLASSADGRRLFSGNTDGVVFVADPYVGQQLARYPARADKQDKQDKKEEEEPEEGAAKKTTTRGVRALACSGPTTPEMPLRLAVAYDLAPSEEAAGEAPVCVSLVRLLEVTPSNSEPLISLVAEIAVPDEVAHVDVDSVGGHVVLCLASGDVHVYCVPPMAPLKDVPSVDEAEAALRAAAAERGEPLRPAAPTLVIKAPPRTQPRDAPATAPGGDEHSLDADSSMQSSKGGAPPAAGDGDPAADATGPGPAKTHLLLSGGGLLRPARGLVVSWRANNVVQRFRFAKPSPLPAALPERGENEDDEDAAADEAAAEAAAAAAEEPRVLEPTAEWWQPADVLASAVDPSASMLCVGLGNGAVQVWDTNLGVERYLLEGHEAGVLGVAFFHDRFVASVGRDQTLHICRLEPGRRRASELVAVKHESKVPLVAVATLSDMPVVVTVAADQVVRAYDLATGTSLGRLAPGRGGEWMLASSAWTGAMERCARGAWPSPAGLDTVLADAQWEVAGDQIVLLTRPTTDAVMEAVAAQHSLQDAHNSAAAAAADPSLDSAASGSVDSAASGGDGGDGGDHDEAARGAPPPPPSTRMLVFFTWDVLAGLCPGIANSIPAGGEQAHFAKHAYLRMTMDQRLNPSARPPPMDPPAALMSLAQTSVSSRKSSTRPQKSSISRSRGSSRHNSNASSSPSLYRTESRSVTPQRSVDQRDDAGAGGDGDQLPDASAAFMHPVTAVRVPRQADVVRQARMAVMGPMHVREQREQQLLKRRQEIRQAFAEF